MNGNTALHHAARNVHVRLVQLLCSRGADVSIRNKQGIQARGVKPWDGKRGWNTTPERWSQETKDAVRDIKNALQEAFNKQRMKKEIEQREMQEQQEMRDRSERIKRRAEQAKEKEKKDEPSTGHSSKKLELDEMKPDQHQTSPQSLMPQRLPVALPPTPPPPSMMTPSTHQMTLTPTPPPHQQPAPASKPTDYGQQLIAVSTQVSSVSSQISHVNTTVMRLADQQSMMSQKEHMKEIHMKEILDLAKQNQTHLQRIELQLQQLTASLQPDTLAKTIATLLNNSPQ